MKWIMGSAAVVGTVAFVTSLVFFISVPLPTEVSDSSTKSDGLSEGIQVHGDWTIEVHDPDGTLVEKREFENEFKGAGSIVSILKRETRPGLWEIRLHMASSAEKSPPLLTGHVFRIGEPSVGELKYSDGTSIYSAGTLTVSGEDFQSATQDGKLTLQGELTTSKAHIDKGFVPGTGIFKVKTTNALCEAGAILSDCLKLYSEGGSISWTKDFSSKELQPYIYVEEGQKVIVTVTLSFS
jgi:hypothetical protein